MSYGAISFCFDTEVDKHCMSMMIVTNTHLAALQLIQMCEGSSCNNMKQAMNAPLRMCLWLHTPIALPLM